MRRHHLVAESKPLAILYKPDARWPLGVEPGKEGYGSVWAKVTFGADGKIGPVSPTGSCFVRNGADEPSPVWEAVERAARQIRFTPELVDSVPVTVTKEVEIRFLAD
jgi:hypothetical protein